MQITFRKILLSVLAVHLIGLILLAFWGLLSPQPVKPQKISVKTIVFREPTIQNIKPSIAPPREEEIAMIEPLQEEEIAILEPPDEEEVVDIIPEPPQIVSKEPTKEPVKETPKITKPKVQTPKKSVNTPKKKPPEKKPVKKPKKESPPPPKKQVDTAQIDQKAAQRRALLLEAKKKLNASPSITKESREIAIELPGEIAPLSIETLVLGTMSKDVGYVDLLISRLKAQLSLPEGGEVKLFLTLNREGKVLELKISHSHSTANKNYVEKMLPKISFSSFGPYFEGEDNHKFDITLRGG